MQRKIVRRMYRLAYMLGVASLLVSMVLGAVPPAPAAAICGGDEKINGVEGTDSYEIDAPEGKIITEVWIKSGQGCFHFTSDGTDGCYTVSGLETDHV
ncbi:MAG: hypothetical protein IH859_07305, partial [Chloroflexi bacterium]|nr:hypothetical protein [Chloroflexota bacterium]